MAIKKTDSMDKNEVPEFTYKDVFNWTEFASWTVVVLLPFLYWVNGPAVSRDQLIVRSTLAAVSVLCALGSLAYRAYLWFQRKKTNCRRTETSNSLEH